MTKNFKVIVEKHEDGYVAYPLGMKGVVVGQGNSYEEALADVRSAISFHNRLFRRKRLQRRAVSSNLVISFTERFWLSVNLDSKSF